MQMEESSEHTRQNILRKEIAWMQRGARARSTKQKAHIQRYEALRDQKAPERDTTMDMKQIGSIGSRMGKSTIEIENLCKAFGDREIIRDFTYTFQHHDRVGFLGRNGCGKTTLMKILTGRENYDSGVIKIGQTIKIGYYAQEISEEASKRAGSIEYMDPNMKVIDYIRNTAEYIKTSEGLVSASSMLDRFLFPPSEQYSLIEKLSGGERRRLNLLRVLMENPNVLILDEPTNDLDTETLAVLEDFLDSFDGIVITVSHDRYFLDRIVTRMFVFQTDATLVPFEGSYTDYMKKYGFCEGKARIAHCLSESTAKTLAQRIKAEFPRANVVISECRALCSFYAERGGLLLGFEV
jgi:ATP-binding cassette subfamily F protein uup